MRFWNGSLQECSVEILVDPLEGGTSKLRVVYDDDSFLVLVGATQVTAYLERELPESPGVTMPRQELNIRIAALQAAWNLIKNG